MPGPAIGHALVDTAIGTCALAWGERGIVRVLLSGFDAAAVRELPPPPAVADAARRIAALLDGAPDDLADVALDWQGVPAFPRRCYELARAIPPGETRTYGEVAALAGEPGGAQAVGQAMARNPFPIVVPCHRVVASGGRLGGFSAPGGNATKRRMLELEGARERGELTLFG